jgi:hypothetical protein
MPAATINNISGASRKRVAADYDSDQTDELVDVRQASSELRSEPVRSAIPVTPCLSIVLQARQ